GAATGLRAGAGAAGVDVAWLERALDAEFSLIRTRRADAGLGWLTASPDALPAQLDAMSLGQFEPEVWIPRSHPEARHGVIGLDELASMDVIHGPRRASTATYDRSLKILRATHPRFEFTDPPVRHSLPVALTFAATASRPTAVLTGPTAIAGPPPGVTRLPRPAGAGDMTRVSIAGHPLTATAALIWSRALPRSGRRPLPPPAPPVLVPPPRRPSPAPRPAPGHYPVPSPSCARTSRCLGISTPHDRPLTVTGHGPGVRTRRRRTPLLTCLIGPSTARVPPHPAMWTGQRNPAT